VTPSEVPPARSRGVIALLDENCTSCMLCARECPDWCIYIESHQEMVAADPNGGRARTHNVLDRFAIDYSLCMYCGICIEVCPYDALFWSPVFDYPGHDVAELTHERDRLGAWLSSSPAAAAEPSAPE
jgi:NADH-quinone oxidoreductase subunit I